MTDNLIGDRYVLGPLLGRGGMAEVRRARDTRLERDVAIKRLKVDLAGDPIFQERFRREAHAAAGLNHPNIVSVFDTGESFDETSGLMVPYIVMELVVGHTLREILHDGRKIQPIKALELVQSILDALDYSHRHGIIHRDIKPANVMLTANGQVKVMDFGIARAVSDTAASMTQTASVIGTPQYLSPEQIRGEKVDRRSDVYATGCLLYELLTGKPPFEGDSPVSLAYQHVRATPVSPSELDPLVSTQMDAIVLKSLAKAPADRYQSAHEMSEDIARLLAGQKVQAIVPPPAADPPTEVIPNGERTQVMPSRAVPQRAVRPVDQVDEEPSHLGRIVGIVLAIMLVIALVAAGVIYWANREPAPPPNQSPAKVSVPYLQSMTEDNARKALAIRNLDIEVQSFPGPDDNTVGQVTGQFPTYGTEVEVGTTVIVQINVGPDKFTITNVVGWAVADAQAELEKTFANITTVNASPADEKPEDQAGTVVKMDPAGGSLVTAEKLITLYVATGQVKLPNLVGLTKEQATKALVDLGISADDIFYTDDMTTAFEPGRVTNMHPEQGETVAKDVTIDLGIAIAPPPPPTEPPSPTPSETPSATPGHGPSDRNT